MVQVVDYIKRKPSKKETDFFFSIFETEEILTEIYTLYLKREREAILKNKKIKIICNKAIIIDKKRQTKLLFNFDTNELNAKKETDGFILRAKRFPLSEKLEIPFIRKIKKTNEIKKGFFSFRHNRVFEAEKIKEAIIKKAFVKSLLKKYNELREKKFSFDELLSILQYFEDLEEKKAILITLDIHAPKSYFQNRKRKIK